MGKKRLRNPGSKPSWGKATGVDKSYFILHNILSMIVFISLIYKLQLSSNISTNLVDIFSLEFLGFIGIIFGLTIIIGFFSRLFSYFLLKIYYNSDIIRLGKVKREVPSFLNMNQGLNEFFTYPYFIRSLIMAIVFAIGVAELIQHKIFGGDSLYALILSYLLVKGVIWIFIYIKYK